MIAIALLASITATNAAASVLGLVLVGFFVFVTGGGPSSAPRQIRRKERRSR